jgi:hypothetical protein
MVRAPGAIDVMLYRASHELGAQNKLSNWISEFNNDLTRHGHACLPIESETAPTSHVRTLWNNVPDVDDVET